MKFGNLIKSGLAAAALVAGIAHATPQYYFGNAPTANGSFPQGCPAAVTSCEPIVAKGFFTGDVDVSSTETFETRAPGLLGAAPLTVLGSGALSQSAVPSGFLGGKVLDGSAVSGRFNTTNGATSGRWFESDYGFTIQLSGDVGALGFYGTDFNDFAGTLEIELLNDGARVYENVFTDANGDPLALRTTTTSTQDGSLIFFGFASDLVFDRIVFKVTQSPNTPTGDWDYLGFDDIMIGNLRTPTGGNVPEPGSLALAGLALFAAGWARRTQRRA